MSEKLVGATSIGRQRSSYRAMSVLVVRSSAFTEHAKRIRSWIHVSSSALKVESNSRREDGSWVFQGAQEMKPNVPYGSSYLEGLIPVYGWQLPRVRVSSPAEEGVRC